MGWLSVIHARHGEFIIVHPWELRGGFAQRYVDSGGYRVLPLQECRAALWLIRHQDRSAYLQLIQAFDLDRYEDEAWVEDRLEKLLGPGGWDDPPGPFAAFYVLGRVPPKRAPRRESVAPRTFQPAPLSATHSSVTVECFSEGDEHAPVRGVELEVITGAGDVRRVSSDGKGIAFVDGIAPGKVRIRVLGVDGKSWRPADGEASQPSAAAPRLR